MSRSPLQIRGGQGQAEPRSEVRRRARQGGAASFWLDFLSPCPAN